MNEWRTLFTYGGSRAQVQPLPKLTVLRSFLLRFLNTDMFVGGNINDYEFVDGSINNRL